DDKGWDARKRAYCLKIQPATGSFARNLIYSTKPAITYNCGSAHRCTYQPHYAYNINIPVRHNDPESIDNIRGALHYLAKEEQKD
ncbi:hypothetical protein ACRW6T_28355, partial [Escherichia coli]